jgi:hypothetical protein
MPSINQGNRRKLTAVQPRRAPRNSDITSTGTGSITATRIQVGT